jgi:hypothetical protein
VGGDRISVPMGLKGLYGQEVNRKALGKMYCNVLLRIFIVHSRATSFFLIQFLPGLLYGFCLDC